MKEKSNRSSPGDPPTDCLVELLTPKQASLTVEADLQIFQERCAAIVACDCMVSLPDNPLGHLHFTAPEVLAYQETGLQSDKLLIHLNTFHRKSDLDAILDQASDLGITRLLCVSGDGGSRLTKLEPADPNLSGNTVTSIELLRYIAARHRERFTCGVAFRDAEGRERECLPLGAPAGCRLCQGRAPGTAGEFGRRRRGQGLRF